MIDLLTQNNCQKYLTELKKFIKKTSCSNKKTKNQTKKFDDFLSENDQFNLSKIFMKKLGFDFFKRKN